MINIPTEAIYQHGVLKPKKRLKIPEGSKVRIVIMSGDEMEDPLDKVIGICKGGPKDGAKNHDQYIQCQTAVSASHNSA